MRTRPNSIALAVTTLGAAALFACGSSQKPEPVTYTPAPVETAPEPRAAEPVTPEVAVDAGATPTAADKSAACTTHLHDAQAEMDAELIKVDTTCKKDADCMTVKGHACDFTCTTAAIPKAEQKEWDREMTALGTGACKAWTDGDCAKLTDTKAPTCADEGKKASCQKGHCVLK